MTSLGRKQFLLACSGQLLPPQEQGRIDDKEKPKRMPDGTLQSEAILKDEQKRMLSDAQKLVELSNEVEAELKKNDRHVLSVGLLKKLEDVEKLAKRMRSRHSR